MAGIVVGTRVSIIGGAAAGVVGEREVHHAGTRAYGTPFRTVHLGGAGNVGRQTGVDQHIALIGKTVERNGTHSGAFGIGYFGRERCIFQIQSQPLTGTVFIELGDVQCAFVQQVIAAQTRLVSVFTDELVDVFVGGIVTGVEHNRLTSDRNTKHHAFMTETAQSGAFFRG